MNKNIRNVFVASLISASVIASAAFATPAAAQSVTDLQVQIQELLAKVAALQEQLRTALGNQSGGSSTSSDITVRAVPRICAFVPAQALGYGASGDAVTGLQEFLRSEGVFSLNATGYFGPATREAVAKWQVQQGLEGVGALGPLTRARIQAKCGTSDALSVSPQKGQAPLTVTVTARVGDESPYRPSAADGQDTLVDFGDGSERVWVQCETVDNDQFGGPTHGRCVNPMVLTHVYTNNGTYTVKLLQAGGFCAGSCPERIIATAYVTVGDGPVACTKEYRPVCGSKPVVCITAPCNPIQQTYGNRCMMEADGATYLHDGACKDASYDPQSDPRCKSWYDGCNTCSRSTPNGPAMCTLRACTPESMTKPYCTAYFDGTTGNQPPVVSSLSGPTTLSAGESGSWTIRASDPENDTLTYSISWGDEVSSAAASPSIVKGTFTQTTILTHSYARPGTYTVLIVVRDTNGNEAKASTTVKVEGGVTACTLQYDPVCGRPTGCANTCPPGMYCAAICRLHDPVTYGNRCQLNASGAEYLHDGACTPSSGNWY